MTEARGSGERRLRERYRNGSTHADLRTTLIYADYALDPNRGALYAERAFGPLGSLPNGQPRDAVLKSPRLRD